MQNSGFSVVASQLDSSRRGFNFVRAGFHIKFQHCTVSVQFGTGNYCGNRDDAKIVDNWVNCSDAEVAVMDNDVHDWVSGWPHSSPHDQVAGWLTSDQVADVIAWAKTYKP